MSRPRAYMTSSVFADASRSIVECSIAVIATSAAGAKTEASRRFIEKHNVSPGSVQVEELDIQSLLKAAAINEDLGKFHGPIGGIDYPSVSSWTGHVLAGGETCRVITYQIAEMPVADFEKLKADGNSTLGILRAFTKWMHEPEEATG